MSKYWSEIVRNIEPYVPGEQPQDKKYIKLNTNENPYGPSPKVIEAIKKAADDDLRLYPDPTCDTLCSAIAKYYNLQKDQIFAGNGSDEILAFCFQAFFNPGNPILFPDITYSFYPVFSQLYKIDYRPVPLDDEFNIRIEGFFIDNGGIIFPNPNAPTGTYLKLELIRDILAHNMNNVVIVDEAYIDFGGESAVKLINEYPNLLVVQTLSKSRSLAGMRGGYALGHRDLIEALSRIKNSFNSYTLDRPAIVGGVEAIKDEAYFQENKRKVINTRERVSIKLCESGFKVLESKANFVFISHPLYSGKEIFLELKRRGILVRHFSMPRIEEYLRVSIGTDEDMDRFLKAIFEITSRASS
jgi:histidinol-phosphate aminotransferase